MWERRRYAQMGLGKTCLPDRWAKIISNNQSLIGFQVSRTGAEVDLARSSGAICIGFSPIENILPKAETNGRREG